MDKKLKPAKFHSLDLEVENYTEQLWIFEGITSYYDELSLLRCKILTPTQYLTLFTTTCNAVLKTPGRLKQSVAEASFNAWTGLYQADENTGNTTINYYSKGCLVAFLLDIEIRKRTNHNLSLDSVVRYVYYKFVKTGLNDNDFKLAIEVLTASNFDTFFTDFIYGVKELPLQQAFDFVGIKMIVKPSKPSLGCELTKTTIIRVPYASCCQKGGLYTGDKIITINDIEAKDVDQQINNFTIGDTVSVGVFRDNKLIHKEITLEKLPYSFIKLKLSNTIDRTTKNYQKSWFYGLKLCQ